METVILLIIFVFSMIALIKGADWFLESAEKVGFAIGLSPFIVGITIVSLGTSFPELFTGIMAVVRGTPEIVVANAIGSNIANILLVVGLSALIAGRLTVSKSLIDLDLPLLAVGTTLLLVSIYPFFSANYSDALINRAEAIILIVGYLVYILYTAFHQSFPFTNKLKIANEVIENPKKRKLKATDFLFFILGIIFLMVGSNYLIESVVKLSNLHQIAVGVISIIAVAIGTTLPELFVSVKAARKGNSELALGNIFGSNIFNSLMVIGIPGIIGDLPLDKETFSVGIPFLVLATLLFVISGISRRIHAYEGAFYLLIYILFIVKIFNLF